MFDDALFAAQADVKDAPGPSTGAMEKVKKSIEQGLLLIAERQKLIKIADRSDHDPTS